MEAEALNRWADDDRRKGNVALHRLEGLWKSCKQNRPAGLSYALADLNFTQAKALQIAEPALALEYAKKADIYAIENRKLSSRETRDHQWSRLSHTRLKSLISSLESQNP